MKRNSLTIEARSLHTINLLLLNLLAVEVVAVSFTTSSIVTAWSVPITLQVYVPASNGSGLEMVKVDTRDGTSKPLPFVASIDNPFVNVTWCLLVPVII